MIYFIYSLSSKEFRKDSNLHLDNNIKKHSISYDTIICIVNTYLLCTQ